MRYVLAIAALVLSGVLLLLGIGQRTFLAGPSEIGIAIDTQSETGFAVLDAGELAKLPGQANVVVRGADAFVATGATRDVEAWTEPYSHAKLTVDARGQRMLSALVAPAPEDTTPTTAAPETAAPADDPAAETPTEDAAGLDPRGSDLWLSERSIDERGSGTEAQTLRVPVALSEGQSVLIASTGTDPLPADASVVWAQDRETPWAGPLLVGGGLLALAGGVLYLLAIDHDRRGLGPRRGRRGPLLGIRNLFGRRAHRSASSTTPPAPPEAEAAPGRATRSARATRRIALPALGLAVAVGLTGCSASYWPAFGGEPAPEQTEEPASGIAPVPVTEGQLDRIVADVAAVSGEADDSFDAAALDARFTGDALEQRAANYTIRAAMPEYGVIPPRITDEALDYELVQSTETWPRTVFVTVASSSGAVEEPAGEEVDGETPEIAGEANGEAATTEDSESSPSLALVLTQQNPHENFHVSRVVALRGGISMPQAAPAEEGTAVLAGDTGTLVLQPDQVGAAYAAVLQNGADIPEAESFDLGTDTLLENYGKARAEQSQQQSDEKGQTMAFSVTARQGDEPITALSTGTGGALVATTVIEEQVVDAAGGRYKPQAKDAVTALSGLEGEQERLVQQVAHQMLFYVPSKTDGSQIQLLGVTSELVGVTN
ncbi:glycosyltransferase [Leucobacter allii]|uniref:glycosyltransferase n=1 Tax=Leucobacter allii TaxID=2932247 RepID=UPI001FD02299|nr:glycosyltransferase [Leucobacter allii]UOR00284.1 glycosyltransferase [Leucobacter allii]